MSDAGFRLPQAGRIRAAIFILLGCPVVVLAGSYALLAVRHGAWNLFPAIIHENGRYTLTETIFYFRHFVRELPVNTLIALALGILACLHSPLGADRGPERSERLSKLRRRAGLAALFMAVAAILLTWLQLDRRETWIELAQYRTRDELSEFGSHWRYHLLHIVDSVLFCLGLLLVVRGCTSTGTVNRCCIRGMIAWWLVFALITYGFGSPLRALTDPLYLAHQAREIETHRLLTLCPVLGCILWIDRRLEATFQHEKSGRRMLWRGVFWMAAATTIPLGIFFTLRHADIPALAGRRADLWQLAAAHHFEHVLDNVYVVLLTAWVYLTVPRTPACFR